MTLFRLTTKVMATDPWAATLKLRSQAHRYGYGHGIRVRQRCVANLIAFTRYTVLSTVPMRLLFFSCFASMAVTSSKLGLLIHHMLEQDPHVPLSWMCSPKHYPGFLHLWDFVLFASGVIQTRLSPHNFYQFLQLFNSNISTRHLRYLPVRGEAIPRHSNIWRHSWISIAATNTDTATIVTAVKLAVSASGCRTRIRMQVNNHIDNYRKRFFAVSVSVCLWTYLKCGIVAAGGAIHRSEASDSLIDWELVCHQSRLIWNNGTGCNLTPFKSGWCMLLGQRTMLGNFLTCSSDCFRQHTTVLN